MIYLGDFTATGKMEPLFVAGHIEVGDGEIGSVIDGLIECQPTALLGVGMDDVGREEITRIIHDDDFWSFSAAHSNRGFGCQRGTRG